MSERWGDSQRDRDALDRHITREPDDHPELTIHELLTGEQIAKVQEVLEFLSDIQVDHEWISWTTLDELEQIVKGRL